MAKIINLTVLQVNQYSLQEATIEAVPVNNILASPVDILVNGIQANSLVEILPSGLNQVSQNLLVEETVSQIVALANMTLINYLTTENNNHLITENGNSLILN